MVSSRVRYVFDGGRSSIGRTLSGGIGRLTVCAVLLLGGGVSEAQREFRVYPSFEGAEADAPLPADWDVPAELVIGRLMYPGGGFGFYGSDWRRGGFLFCDSFFDTRNWVVFQERLSRVFPERPIIDLTDDHPIFHSVFDLPSMTTVQIPNWNSLRAGGRGYMGDSAVPRWRAVVDDDGRLMVPIAFNNDVADGWQWADDPRYPSEVANLSLQLGVNVAMHAMTH